VTGGRLFFPLGEVLRVADATLAGTEWGDSFTDQEAGRKTGPALMWVKDAGTYLMPNLTGAPDPADVLYGRDGSPTGTVLDGDADYGRVREVCGGDDFAEYLPLTPEFMERLRAMQAQGAAWLVLDVAADGESFGVYTAKR
jgi:hypothetical protein